MVEIKYLPTEERVKVACYCNSAAQWSLDTDKGYVVCSLCGKPAPDIVLRICVTCGLQFVLERSNPKWRPKWVVFPNGKVVESEFECITCY